MEFQLSLPLFAYRLELARFVHLAELTLRLLLQSLEVLFPLAEVLGDGKEQLVELCLRLFRLGHLLARSQLLLGEVKLLQACSLFAERRLYLYNLILILEHINADPWRSLRLDLLFIIKVQILVDPVVQDEHELLDLIKEFLVLVIKFNQLGVLLFVRWLKIDLKLLLPFLLQVFEFTVVVQLLELRLWHFLQAGEHGLLGLEVQFQLLQLFVETLMLLSYLFQFKITCLQVRQLGLPDFHGGLDVLTLLVGAQPQLVDAYC